MVKLKSINAARPAKIAWFTWSYALMMFNKTAKTDQPLDLAYSASAACFHTQWLDDLPATP